MVVVQRDFMLKPYFINKAPCGIIRNQEWLVFFKHVGEAQLVNLLGFPRHKEGSSSASALDSFSPHSSQISGLASACKELLSQVFNLFLK